PSAWDALYDSQCFSKALPIAGGFAVGTPSGVVDTGVEAPNSVGYQLLVDFDVVDPFAGPAGAQLILKLQSATDAAFSAPVDHVTLPALTLAELAQAGWQMPTFKWGNYGGAGMQCVLTLTAGVITAAALAVDGSGNPIRGSGYPPSAVGLLRITDTTGTG